MSYQGVEAVLDNGPADTTEAMVMLCIAERANEARPGYAYPGIAEIARRARIHQRHVIRVVDKLAKDGWLVKLPKAEGEGKQRGKFTAYQLDMAKLSSNGSRAAQIAHEKARAEERRRLKEESHAAQIAHEKSGDIAVGSQVTFEPESDDILRFPILKNQGTTEPASADASERVIICGDLEAQAPPPSTRGPELVKPTGGKPGRELITDEQVETIRLAFPLKVKSVPARNAIRAAHGLLMRGAVRRARDGEFLAKMSSQDAYQFLYAKTEAYAVSPKGRSGRFAGHAATWFNAGSYAEDPADWGPGGEHPSNPARVFTPGKTVAEQMAEQRQRSGTR